MVVGVLGSVPVVVSLNSQMSYIFAVPEIEAKGDASRPRRTVGQAGPGEAAMGQAVDSLQQPTRSNFGFVMFEQGLIHMRVNHLSASSFIRLPRQTQHLVLSHSSVFFCQ